jgi:phosphopentomutase
VPPLQGMLLDRIEECGVPVYGVGTIFDVFLGRGIRESVETKNNPDGMGKIIEAMGSFDAGLIFVNLVDFD